MAQENVTLDQVKRQRTGARSWLTRIKNNLQALMDEPERDLSQVKYQISQFEARLQKYDEAQSEVETLIINEDDLEADIMASADYRDNVCTTYIRARDIIEASEKQETILVQDQLTAPVMPTVQSTHSAKLPKLELPKFNGEVTEWTSFWDRFAAVVHTSTTLAEITKFTYLQSLLKGEAAAAIKGLQTTAENYGTAVDILHKRFGRKERIIFGHISQLLTSQLRKGDTNLWTLHDDLQAHVRSLENLGISQDTYGIILTPLILHRFPSEIRLEWARVGEGKEGDLSFLMSFFNDEIRRRERAHQHFAPSSTASPQAESSSEKAKRRTTGAALAISTGAHTSNSAKAPNRKQKCVFCNEGHYSSECPQIIDLDFDQRKSKLRSLRRCFICLGGNHLAKDCNRNCSLCHGMHHRLLCSRNNRLNPATQVKDNSLNQDVTDVTNQFKNLEPSGVSVNRDGHRVGINYAHSRALGTTTIMQTIHWKLKGRRVSILFDSGADRSFISKGLAQELGLELVGREPVSFSCFGSGKVGKEKSRDIYRLALGAPAQDLHVIEIDHICTPMFRQKIPLEHLGVFAGLPFTEDFSVDNPIKIDILVGIDHYWQFMKPNYVHSSVGLVAQETSLGSWILSGSWPSVHKGKICSSQFLCQTNNISESLIRKFWELDAIGVMDKNEASDDTDTVLAKFKQNIHYEGDRYMVSLPWKSEDFKCQLLNNKPLAEKRLDSLTRKLARDPELAGRYSDVFLDLERSGIIKEVLPEEETSPHAHPIYYMPHRPVVRESSSSTKVRPVFDASAAGFNGVSLNDCLEKGPCLIPNLVSILMRFRRHPIAFTADITKAFLQIRVDPKDQDVHRFLWKFGARTKVMKFDRVPFGNKASPFLLNATIQHHLSKFPAGRTISELQTNLYVDDFLSGADSLEDAHTIISEAKNIMSSAGMCLAKWSSNKDELCAVEKNFSDLESEFTKVLGLKWKSVLDCFSFTGLEIPTGLVVTKRVILSFIARLFDPLGFVTPFTIRAKFLFQELWLQGIDWDLEVPSSISDEFLGWLGDLASLQTWNIPRCYVQQSWSGIGCPEIHIFCDASEKGYGCCAYLRVQENARYHVSLMFSRARVAPVKRITLPRLELMGALLGARTLKFIQDSHVVGTECTYFCYTDSMITLSWIQSRADKWKCFVANRVREIQSITDPCNWSHCAGSDNPADLVTRGLTASQLMASSKWLNGPSWLQSGDVNSGKDPSFLSLNPELSFEEEVGMEMTVCHSDSLTPAVLPVERWSTLSKSVRILAWIYRFFRNASKCLTRKTSGDLEKEELGDAETKLFWVTQQEHYLSEIKSLQKGNEISRSSVLYKMHPFLDEGGLLRMGGRLQFSALSFEERHPIILPKGHVALLLTRSQHLFLKHAGVGLMVSSLRDKFWIIGSRALARRVKKECFHCQRFDAGPSNEPFAPLPETRVTKAPPFSVTGLDYAGPLYCSDHGDQKFYILLFTCGVVRAIHLELVMSMKLSDFLLAFRRFVARRGMPSIVYSDNAKTFISGSREISKAFGTRSPNWKFIAPRSPWWGGWWERMVRSIKSILRKVIGGRSLPRTELDTLLQEAEACINSRPLTSVNDDVEENKILTPFHFLLGRGCHLLTTKSLTSSVNQKIVTEQYLVQQAVLDQFWRVWSRDYLRNLPQVKTNGRRGSVKEGMVVLLREDNTSRLHWPLGVVTKLFPGKDGIPRTLEIRTAGGLVTRSIQRVHSLELDSGEADSDLTVLRDVGHHPHEVDVTFHGREGAEETFKAAKHCAEKGTESERGKSIITRTGRTVRPKSVLDL